MLLPSTQGVLMILRRRYNGGILYCVYPRSLNNRVVGNYMISLGGVYCLQDVTHEDALQSTIGYKDH